MDVGSIFTAIAAVSSLIIAALNQLAMLKSQAMNQQPHQPTYSNPLPQPVNYYGNGINNTYGYYNNDMMYNSYNQSHQQPMNNYYNQPNNYGYNNNRNMIGQNPWNMNNNYLQQVTYPNNYYNNYNRYNGYYTQYQQSQYQQPQCYRYGYNQPNNGYGQPNNYYGGYNNNSQPDMRIYREIYQDNTNYNQYNNGYYQQSTFQPQQQTYVQSTSGMNISQPNITEPVPQYNIDIEPIQPGNNFYAESPMGIQSTVVNDTRNINYNENPYTRSILGNASKDDATPTDPNMVSILGF